MKIYNDKEIWKVIEESKNKIKVILYKNKNKGGRIPNDYSVYRIDMKTNEILEKIDSLIQYEPDSKRRRSIKSVCCDFRKKSVYGYKWKFVKEDSDG